MPSEPTDPIMMLKEEIAQSVHVHASGSAPLLTAPPPHENSTDATRGEPLVQRAQKREAELAALLAKLPADDLRARTDVENALATVEGLLTGDLANVSHMTSAGLSRWLETNKHLAEMASDVVPKQVS